MIRGSGSQGGMSDKAFSAALAKRNLRFHVKSATSRQRILGSSGLMSGTYTVFGCYSAPDHYDAVRIALVSPENSTNGFKVSVMPSAAFNDGVNALNSTGGAVTPTPVTWGSTNYRNPRNPGGGAANTTITGAAGASPNFIEGKMLSDIIPISSLPRTDFPSRKPLLMVRLFGTNPPGTTHPGLSGLAASSYKQVNPDHWCQFLLGSTDYTGTASGVPVTTAAFDSSWMPAIEIVYYLRGRRIPTIAGTGDSIDMGWNNTASVNSSIGNMNGWQRQFAALCGAGFTAWHRDGYTGSRFNELAMNALLYENGQGVTHQFIKVSSVNNWRSDASTVNADILRATQLVSLCYEHGIVPILVYPWAGQDIGSAPELAIRAYIDNAKAGGIPTFDARALVSASGSTTDNNIKPEYQSKNSSNGVVDTTHINGACETAIAALAYSKRAEFFLPA